MEKNIRVAVFEDNYLLRDSYYQLINGTIGFSCVGAFDNANDLIFKLKRCEPEVVLMDIDMPGVNGIEAVALITQHFPGTHVIMQTVFEDDDKIFNAIQNGAEGYILKKTPPAKMLESIQEVYSGGAPMTPAIAAKTLELFRSKIKFTANKNENQLSERQKEILDSIVSGMSYKMIAEKFSISIDTVRYHVKNIYEILQVHSRFELMNKKGR
ncbi:MAG TPA: response regulator transcription factor [Puia sp.]|nr:response regulator transcription factor [Puia sp.]